MTVNISCPHADEICGICGELEFLRAQLAVIEGEKDEKTRLIDQLELEMARPLSFYRNYEWLPSNMRKQF